MMKIVLIVISVILYCGIPATADNNIMRLPIIAGAESHGMLDACDCEHEPGGGVAKRATFINTFRKESEILLLDAGGFSAGGIYDDYTEGRIGDSLRTSAMIKAMAAMGYDAVGIGDDDLQFGGNWLVQQSVAASLPLVCANCFYKNNKLLTSPYIIVHKFGKRIGITAVCTPEKLFPTDSQVIITDPVDAVQALWKDLSGKSDVQIILSHTGQEESQRLAQLFPGCDLLVNGHRKSDGKPVVFSGTIPIMQFGFQGKSLSGLILTNENGTYTTDKIRWCDITPELEDEQHIRSIVENATAPTPLNNLYDLYVMSQCPYGLEAISAMLEFTNKKRTPAWNIWFIGTIENDSALSSLHGPGEIEDEKMWLAMQRLYPDKWHCFLEIRTKSSKDTRVIISECGGDINKIDAWVVKNGIQELGKQYNRSMRLAIESSPSLLINNRPFEKNINELNLMKFECTTQHSSDSLCSALPECSQDTDCKASRKIGSCNENGKCIFADDVRFPFTVVTAESTFQHPEKTVIATTQDLFPAAMVTILPLNSKAGQRLVGDMSSSSLPLYFFGEGIVAAHNFSRIESGLKKKKGGYIFKDGIVASNYHCDRPKKSGAIILYIDPFFNGLHEIFEILQNDSTYASRVTVEPVIFSKPYTVRPGTEEYFRQEEALRWIILGKRSANEKMKYLSAYRLHPGTSYWTSSLHETGINPDTISRQATLSRDLLETHWKTLVSLSIRETVVLLIDNVEIVVPGGIREIRRLLNQRIH